MRRRFKFGVIGFLLIALMVGMLLVKLALLHFMFAFSGIVFFIAALLLLAAMLMFMRRPRRI